MIRNDPVVERLDRIFRLLVLVATQEKSQRERVELLSLVGLRPSEIADILGTTPNTVNVALHMIRKQPNTRRRARKSDE